MADRLGFGSFIGFGVKTDATSTKAAHAVGDIKWWSRVEEGFDDIQGERDRLGFHDLSSEYEVAAHVRAGQRRVTGNLSVKMTFDSWQDLLRFFTAHNVAVSGAGPYTYAFVPVAYGNAAHVWAGTTSRLMTIEVHRGGSANSMFYYGCVIKSLALTFDGNARVAVTMGIVGRGWVSGTKSTPVYPTDPIITPTGQATAMVTLGGTPYKTQKVGFSIDTGAEHVYDVSAIETELPILNKTAAIKLNLEVRPGANDSTWMDMLDNQESALDAILTLDNGAAAGANRKLIWTFPAVRLDSPAEPRVRGQGLLTVPLQLTGMSLDGSAPGYSVTLINGESNYKQNPLP